MSDCAYEIKQAVDEALGKERAKWVAPYLATLQRRLRLLRSDQPAAHVELRVTGTTADLANVRVDGIDTDWKLKPLERRLKKATWPSGSGNVEQPASAAVRAALLQLVGRVISSHG